MDKNQLADIVVRQSGRAQEFLRSQQRTLDVLKNATHKMQGLRGPAGRVFGDLRVLIRMVRSSVSGAYGRMPKKSLIAAMAGLLYFVNPFDIVPDVLPMIGYLDDAAVISFVWRSLQDDVQEFLDWEQKSAPARAA
jgi:uncharacterized membrane protein YkvA (DUF1232 family)